MFVIILHTSSGPRVSMPVHRDYLAVDLARWGSVLERGERLEVVPAPADGRATECVDGSPSWFRIPA